jgi:hypothetical protein
MKASYPLAVTALCLLAAPLPEAAAQSEIGVQLDLFSAYVWRGITYTNRPVAQPDVWIGIPVGKASITAGGWASIEIGKYDDPADDVSESGGLSAFDVAELNPYAEVSVATGRAAITGGIVGYVFPNDLDDAPNGGLDGASDTWEVYASVGLDLPLAPELSFSYDLGKVQGAYLEGAVAHSVRLAGARTLDLGALVGLDLGQSPSEDDESFNFDGDGLTHLDLSAALPLSAGGLSITPVVHLQIGVDDATRFHSPGGDRTDLKLWGGVSIGWSSAVGGGDSAER